MTEVDLSKLFKPPVKKDRPLPEAFEDNCKGKDCGRRMQRVPCNVWGDCQPYATFHCQECNIFLYVFPAEPDLVVWGDALQGTINIRKRIDELIEARAHKEQRRRVQNSKTNLVFAVFTRPFALLQRLRRRV